MAIKWAITLQFLGNHRHLLLLNLLNQEKLATLKRGIPIAYKILDSLRKLHTYNKTVIIQWIPSQVGIPGNEKVDGLVKVALTTGIPFRCLPLFIECLYKIKTKSIELWKENFDERSLTKGIWYKTIQPSLTRSPWFAGSGIPRSDIVIAIRLRSGHIPLNMFAYLMGKLQSPTCTECDVNEDVYHVLVECCRVETERALFNYKTNINIREVGQCNSILAHPLSVEAKMLYALVKLVIKRKG